MAAARRLPTPWLFRVCCHIVVAAASLTAVATLRAEEEKKPDNPRAMFLALGIDGSYFDQLADGQPIGAMEKETLLRILYRLRVFPPVELNRWALDAEGLDKALQQPDQSRGRIFRLRGRATQVEPIRTAAETAQRYELAQYYRCRVRLDSPPRAADIYTENVPAAWRKDGQVDAPVGALGVFLKLGQDLDGQALLIFAAKRLTWYPDDLLGRLGMDVGLLDSVKNEKPFNLDSPDDREAFYQMLAAVGRAKPGQLLRRAEENLPKTPENWRWTNRQGQEQYSVVPLFNEPDSQRGQLVELSGVARRIERVPVGEPDIVARFGIDHYYQVSLFTDDSQGNPLTFCVRELPRGMPYGNLPRYGEAVRIAGFFFKTWSYRVPKTADPALGPDAPKTVQQLSPLLIGRSLTWRRTPPPPADNRFSNILIGGLFALVMVIVWFVAWRTRRRERKWLAKMETPPKLDARIDLDQVGQHPDSTPDFSHVAEIDHGNEGTEITDQGPEFPKPS